jgi:Ca2+-binding RTX toxin-like protein
MQPEQLESRTLLSVSYAGRVLSVYGTGGNDVISIALKNGRVAVVENGVQTASFTTVRSILVEGGGGRDKIGIDAKITVAARLIGGSGNDTLSGGSGPDVLLGGSGNDLLLGNAGVDALLGGDNNDTLDGGTGDDYLDGQSGNDTVTYANRTSGIKATLTWDDVEDDGKYFIAGKGGVAGELDRYANSETLIGTAHDDRIGAICEIASAEATFPLLIEAGKGNDYLYTSTFPSNSTDFAPLMRGGEGDDTFSFISPSEATMLGEAGNDRLWHPSTSSDDSIALFDGGAGYDVQDVNCTIDYACAYATYLAPNVEEAVVEAFTYTFRLTDGDDNVLLTVKDRGSYNPLRVEAKAGNDKVTINGEPTYVLGGAGDDTLIGGTGNDTLDGGEGNDVLDGGVGLDTVTYADRSGGVEAWIREYEALEPVGRGGEGDESDTYLSVEVLIGGKGNDSLTGASFRYPNEFRHSLPTIPKYDEPFVGSPSLIGGEGDDEFGFAGNANHWRAYGQAGNDRFIIGSDDDATYDYISGGEGSDWQMVYRSAAWESKYGNALAPDVENALLDGVQYVFRGNDLDNRIIDFGGVYGIYGEGGNDHITVNGIDNEFEIVDVYGGDGNDRLEGGHYGRVSLVGGDGNDVLTGGRYNDTLDGGTGNDALFGKAGDDSLDGGEGNDYLEGNEGVDTLLGNLGDDSFYTRDRIADFIYGGDGTDTLKGDATEAVVDSVEVRS